MALTRVQLKGKYLSDIFCIKKKKSDMAQIEQQQPPTAGSWTNTRDKIRTEKNKNRPDNSSLSQTKMHYRAQRNIKCCYCSCNVKQLDFLCACWDTILSLCQYVLDKTLLYNGRHGHNGSGCAVLMVILRSVCFLLLFSLMTCWVDETLGSFSYMGYFF